MHIIVDDREASDETLPTLEVMEGFEARGTEDTT